VRNNLESELGEEPLVLSSVVSLLKQLLDGLSFTERTVSVICHIVKSEKVLSAIYSTFLASSRWEGSLKVSEEIVPLICSSSRA
jgi:hypothetical protein